MIATRDEFTRTNAAKSDQMNAVDLIAGPMVFMITDIRMTGASDQPVAISVDGHAQPWKPSKTFRRVLTAAWHDEPSEWIGRYVVLWCDPDITWAGEKVGGIAISHMSHIDGDKRFKLNESKSKKKTVNIKPYYPAEAPPAAEPVFWPDDKFAQQLAVLQPKIDSGERTVEQLIAYLEKRAPLTAGQKARIKPTPVQETSESDSFEDDSDPFGDPPPMDE